MKPEDLDRLRERLDAAGTAGIAVPAEAQAAPGRGLRTRLRALLDGAPGPPARRPAQAVPAPSDDRQARRIGPYRVERELGRGGMGVVYLATRSDNQFHKQVAIKVLERARDSELPLRFRRERQMLANLDHPNIARLLDGGATAEGEPYIVMEYVRSARPIDDYSDEHRMRIPARLRLFRQVCAAVQYAHQRLIVHGDLKPGNVLVSRSGEVKLLDFGIASPLIPSLTPDLADQGSISGLTPEYASPEQIRGEPMGTASDVFSLGVLLYELLTGAPPFGDRRGAGQDALRAACRYEPDPPSAHVWSQPWRRPGAELEARGERPWLQWWRLAGDLDRIVLAALSPDPSQRYQSVEALDSDIRRYLDGMPIGLRVQSLPYRAGKFIGRNPGGLAAAALIAASLAGGAGATLRQARAANLQRVIAEAEARQAQVERMRAESSLRLAQQERLWAALRVEDVKARSLLSERQWAGMRDFIALLLPEMDAQIRALRGSEEARRRLAAHSARYLDLLEAMPSPSTEEARRNLEIAAAGHARLAAIWRQLGTPAKAQDHQRKAQAAVAALKHPSPDSDSPQD
jgi:serine/threonine protein kinase